RKRAPDVGERGIKLGVAQRRIRLPHQRRLVELAAAQMAAKLAHPPEMEAKQLLVRDSPPEPALAVGDEAVHRNTHRVDQQGFKLVAPERRTIVVMKFTIELEIGLFSLLKSALSKLKTDHNTNHRRGRSEQQ